VHPAIAERRVRVIPTDIDVSKAGLLSNVFFTFAGENLGETKILSTNRTKGIAASRKTTLKTSMATWSYSSSACLHSPAASALKQLQSSYRSPGSGFSNQRFSQIKVPIPGQLDV